MDRITTVSIADSVVQIVDGLFVGAVDRESIADITASSACKNVVDASIIAIEAVDSSFWRVCSKNDEFTTNVINHFHSIRVVNVAERA